MELIWGCFWEVVRLAAMLGYRGLCWVVLDGAAEGGRTGLQPV